MKWALRKACDVLSPNASLVGRVRRAVERPVGRALLAAALLAVLAASGAAMVVRAHGNGSPAAAVTPGTSNLWAWGLNGDGELGVTTSQTCAGYVCSNVPIPVNSMGTLTLRRGFNVWCEL